MYSDVVLVNGQIIHVTEAFFDAAAWYVRAASKGDVYAAIAQGEGFTQVKDSTGRTWRTSAAFGVQPVAIRPLAGGWELYIGLSPAQYRRVTLDDTLRVISDATFDAPPEYGASQGVLDFAPDGSLLWTDRDREQTFGGVAFGLETTRGDWTIGQDFKGVTGGQLIAWDAAHQRISIVSLTPTVTPSHLVLDAAGLPVVAVAGTAELVPFARFTPWVKPNLPALSVPARARAIWRGLCGGGPGTCTWGVDDTTRPVAEGMPWANAVPNDRLKWLLFSPHETRTSDYPNANAEFAAALTRAHAAQAEVIVIDDGSKGDVQAWVDLAAKAGVRASVGLEAYPVGVELAEATLQRFIALIDGTAAARLALIRPVYAGSGAWSKLEIYRLTPMLTALLEHDARFEFDLGFGRGRGDCYDVWPELQAYWAGLCAVTTAPALVTPVTPVTPKPEPPSPKPPTPAPTPAPIPVHTDEEDMPKTNPTDKLTYPEIAAKLVARPGRQNYADGCLDAYRVLAEGTPIDVVLAGKSAPTQTPIPNVPYSAWEAVADALMKFRIAANQDASYGAGVMDTFRRFSSERWPLEYIIADIQHVPAPARPWSLF